MASYCPSCGVARVGEARFCGNCGRPFDGNSSEGPSTRPWRRRSNPFAVSVMAILVAIGGLYLLNNTSACMSIKCHVFDDTGACFVESMTAPGPVQDILNKIGNEI